MMEEQRKDIVASERERIIEAHRNANTPYYDIVDGEEHLAIFWKEDSPFFQLFQQLDLSKVVELACGHGRHVQKYYGKAGEIVLVDVLEENISYTKERMLKEFGEGSESKIKYYVNNGYDLSELPDASYTALFSYDAVVHFEMLDIFSYLKEIERILRVGGKALIHHSNYHDSYKVSYSQSPHCRNYMSDQLFAYMAYRSGLQVVQQTIINWGQGKDEYKDLDCITLVEKPKKEISFDGPGRLERMFGRLLSK